MFDINHCSHEGYEGAYEGIDGGSMGGEDYLYDTYDQIIDTNRGGQGQDLFDSMGPEEIGLAFALAEELHEEFDREINLDLEVDVDEDTDRENWEQAVKLSSLQSRHGKRKRLRPFEQYVDDICKGRRPLFED
jgi:hypothetical protein